MKIKILLPGLLATSVFLLSASVSATPVSVMKMESVLTDQVGVYYESGYGLEAPSEHIHAVLDDEEYDIATQMANDTKGMRLFKADSGKFDMLSLFALEVKGADKRPTNPLAFALQVDGVAGGVVQVSKQLFTGDLGVINFLSEDAGWTGLDEVQFWYSSSQGYGNKGSWVGDNFEFDDLTAQASVIVEPPVGTVPVPAAVWLFFSALAGLGVVRKKQVIA